MEVDVVSQQGSKSTLNRAQDIARAEMARRRRRLGNLTEEQESAIEILLLLTVFKASEMIKALLNFCSQPLLVGSAEVVRFQ